MLYKVEILDVTYAELMAKINANNGVGELTPMQKYRITDFQTIHKIANTEVVNTGDTEVLQVTAVTPNTLDPIAKSESFPSDIIYYDVSGNLLEEQHRVENNKGFIYRRIEPTKNIDICYDFRVVKVRRYKDSIPDWHLNYQANEIVRFNGRIYRARIGGYNVSPEASPEDWFFIASIPKGHYLFASDNFYIQNQNYDGILTFTEYTDVLSFDIDGGSLCFNIKIGLYYGDDQAQYLNSNILLLGDCSSINLCNSYRTTIISSLRINIDGASNSIIYRCVDLDAREIYQDILIINRNCNLRSVGYTNISNSEDIEITYGNSIITEDNDTVKIQRVDSITTVSRSHYMKANDDGDPIKIKYISDADGGIVVEEV